jgi:predicted ATP-grasp superfamily ATP-dependent carboligase
MGRELNFLLPGLQGAGGISSLTLTTIGLVKVLVLDANSKIALATVRSLSREGHEVLALGPRFSISHFSKFCSQALISQGAHPSAEELARLLVSHQIDVLIPVAAKSVETVHRDRAKLLGLSKFAIAPQDSLDLSLDKFRVQEVAIQSGLLVPASIQGKSFEEFTGLAAEFDLPFVVRSTTHHANSQTIYIRTEDDRQGLLERDKGNHLFLNGPVQIQQLIEGPGEGFFALYQNGTLKRHMMHRRLGEYPTTGGSSWVAQSVDEEDLMLAGKTLLDALDWHGPAMVEFKRNVADDRLYLMELNPKLWGSLDLTIESGVNIPVDLVSVASGDEIAAQSHFKKDLVFWWPLDNLVSLFGYWRIRKRHIKTNIWLRDIKPSLMSFVQLAYYVLFEQVAGGAAGRLLGWVKQYGLVQAFLRLFNQYLGVPTRSTSEVDKRLWIGAEPSRFGRWWITAVKKFHVYSLTTSLSNERPITSKKLKFSSGFHIPEYVQISIEDFDRAVSEIKSVRSSGGRVYLHCREGVGRAPTVGAAVLVSEGYPLESALSRVLNGRKVASLSKQQYSSLLDFYKDFKSRKPLEGIGGI